MWNYLASGSPTTSIPGSHLRKFMDLELAWKISFWSLGAIAHGHGRSILSTTSIQPQNFRLQLTSPAYPVLLSIGGMPVSTPQGCLCTTARAVRIYLRINVCLSAAFASSAIWGDYGPGS